MALNFQTYECNFSGPIVSRFEGTLGNLFSPENDAMKNIMGEAAEQYTVFLVEDDSDDRAQAVRALKKSPYIYNIHCFPSGDRLIQNFINQRYYSSNLMHNMPMLIVLDIHIPGTDGIDVLKELKNHPLTKDIPVIILTGDTSNKAVLDAYNYKANAFITKPLNLDQVHDVIYTGSGWPSAKKQS